MKLSLMIAAGLLAASTALHAQAPKPEGGKSRPGQRVDCSQAKDPKACEEQIAKFRAAREKAHEACRSKAFEEYRACMREQVGRRKK